MINPEYLIQQQEEREEMLFAKIDRLTADRDRWKQIASDLRSAIDIQIELNLVPMVYTQRHYTQHAKDAIDAYEKAAHNV